MDGANGGAGGTQRTRDWSRGGFPRHGKGPGASIRRVPLSLQLVAARAPARLPVVSTTTDGSARRSQQKQHDSDHKYDDAERPQDGDLRNAGADGEVG